MKNKTFYPLFATFLEWYDFAIYIYLANIIGTQFFPSNNKLTSLAGAFTVFAAAYLMRPIGGTILGHLGDKYGRKKILIFSLLLMTIPMIGMSILPVYNSIGLTAIVFLFIFRMIQGFSIGGEYIAVIVLISEHSKDKNRGFMTSFSPCCGGIGVLLASGFVTVLTMFLTHNQLYSWGWRIPYVFGILIAIIAIIMQFTIQETPKFDKISKSPTVQPFFLMLKEYKKQVFIIFVIIAYYSIAFYTIVAFLPSYLQTVLNVQPSIAMKASIIEMLMYVIFMPFLGFISDKVGRKKMMIIAVMVLAIICLPFYSVLYSHLYFAVIILILPITAFEACFTSGIQELIPTNVRYVTCGFALNLSVAIFGGLTPLVFTYLIEITNNYMVPAYVIIVGSCLILPVLWRLKEMAGKPLPE